MVQTKKLQQLDEERIETIALGIIEAYNIKIIPDSAEKALYMMVIKKAFKRMDEHLPQWVVYTIINSLKGTFSDPKDLNKLIQTLADDIHEIVDRWWLPDSMEKDFIETLLNVIFHFAREKVGLENTTTAQVKEITEKLNA